MMIDKMFESFNNLDKRKIPNYIIEYFTEIKYHVNNSEDKKTKIKVISKKYSMIKEELENKIDEELKIFLCLQDKNYDDY